MYVRFVIKWVAAALLRAMIVCAAIELTASSAAPQDALLEKMPWERYLLRLGEKHDCWFTFEVETSNPDRLRDPCIKESDFPSTRDAALRRFSAVYSWLRLVPSHKHRNVIHVIDEKLLAMNDYALEKTADVDFAGVIDHMVLQLHKQIPSIVRRTSGVLGQGSEDGYTEIAFRAERQKVRDILTDCTPRQVGYDRVLWRAETAERENGLQTTVEWSGTDRLFQGVDSWCWPWWVQLSIAGRRLECHYTLETIYRHPDDPKALPVFLPQDEKFTSVKELTDALSTRIPWLEFQLDERIPKLVHVRDRELRELKDYALMKSTSINYSGTPDGLLSLLSDRTGNLFRELNHDPATAFPLFSDVITPIRCRAESLPVRDVLTLGLPLETYEPVLWHARTWLRPSGPQTWVEYRGPRLQKLMVPVDVRPVGKQ